MPRGRHHRQYGRHQRCGAIMARHKARVVADKQFSAKSLHTLGQGYSRTTGRRGSTTLTGMSGVYVRVVESFLVWCSSLVLDRTKQDGDDAFIRVSAPEDYTKVVHHLPRRDRRPSVTVPSASFFFHSMTQLALAFKRSIFVRKCTNIFYTVRGLPSLHSRLKPFIVAGNTDRVIMIS